MCDIEPAKAVRVKGAIKDKIVAADGHSDLVQFLCFSEVSGILSLIDFSLAKDSFSNENEFEDFFKNLEKGFLSSWRSPKHQRPIAENIKRIRIKGSGDISQSKGYRVSVWEVAEFSGVGFYVVLSVDKKLETEFPSKKEIRSLIDIRDSREKNYDRESLEKIIKTAYSDNSEPEDIILTPPSEAERVYLDCPYSEKDQCKALSGLWDKTKKKWFIPAGVDKVKFKRWL